MSNLTVNGKPAVANADGSITVQVSGSSGGGACAKCGVVPNPGCLCTGGYKADHHKPDLSLVPAEFKAEVAKAFMYGAKKYSRHNYLTGMEWHRMRAACERHLDAFWSGEDVDPETGVSHLGHAGACIAMLLMHVKHSLGTDNRWKGAKKPDTNEGGAA